MSRLCWTPVALLAVLTVLCAGGVIAERSGRDTHAEPAAAQAEETGGEAGEPEGAHDEAAESEAAEGHAEGGSGETDSEGEQIFGVDLESTPLVILAVLAGVGLAALTATRLGGRAASCSPWS